jgi:hypothetical protein
MKIRKGFVTNSSSSSYICDYCNRAEVGYDLAIEDADMYECENGHVLCRYHFNEEFDKNDVYKAVKRRFIDEIYSRSAIYGTIRKANVRARAPKIRNLLKGLRELEETMRKNGDILEFAEDWINFSYELPYELCPVCSFKILTNTDGYKYLLKITGMTERELLNKISEEHDSYDDFRKSIQR